MNQDFPLGLSYDDVLLIPQHSLVKSRQEIAISTQITPRVKLQIPLISINMNDVTGVEMAIALGKLGGLGLLPRFNTANVEAEMVAKVKKAGVKVGAAIGIKKDFIERSEMLVKAGVDIITIDVAHAHLQIAIDATSELKRRFGKSVDIISGVIATYEGAKDLFRAGADSVRVGVGPGTICITRIVTGVGVPQITAVLEAARAAKEYKKTVLCDGGTKNSGDVMKGLAAGASAVVIGSQFAGCDEAPGKLIMKNGNKYKTYNASTSLSEKEKHIKANIHTNGDYIKHIEGVESIVPYKGSILNIASTITANLKAGFSYCGAQNIGELHKKAKFIKVTAAGGKEAGPHDVITNF